MELCQQIVKTNIFLLIPILTDARHGTKKTARHTDVICLGNATQKLVAYHELLGTKKIYQELTEKGVTIRRHPYDNNPSVKNMLRESRYRQRKNKLDNINQL